MDDDGVLGLDVVDEPRRQGHRDAGRLPHPGQHPELPDRRHGRRCPRLLRRAIPPEVTHTKQGLRILSRFVLDICGCAALWTPRTSSTTPSPPCAPRSVPQGPARPLRRRGLLGGRRAAAQGHRRPTDLRVRRQRPAAPARRRPGDGHVRREHGREGDPRQRRGQVPRSPGRRRRPGREAQDHRPHLHRSLRRRSHQAAGREVPRPGHHLPRRDQSRPAPRPARPT